MVSLPGYFGGVSMRRFFLLCLLLFFGATTNAQTLAGKVTWVYDGDTIKVAKVGKVRLLGIDCPEREDSPRDSYYLKRYPIQATQLRQISAEARQYVIKETKNHMVTLEFDVQKTDVYGRTLAYVYLADGRMLNRLLLDKGLATVFRRFDFRQKEDFSKRESQAQRQQLGIWQNL